MQSTFNMATKQPGAVNNWWEDMPDAAKIEIKPTEEEVKEMNVKVVKASWLMIFFGGLIRLYCFAVGCVMMAYGGWILYQISTNYLPLSIIAKVAAGVFLVFAGLLTVLAETRNRKTMTHCVNTYIFLANHWTRGAFYIVVGAITFSIDVQVDFIGTFGKSRVLAGFMVAGGLFNIIYAPFRYKYLRERNMNSAPRTLAFGEEIAYGMNPNMAQIKPPVAPAQPLDAHAAAMAKSVEMQLYASNGATPMRTPTTPQLRMAELSASRKLQRSELSGSKGLSSSKGLSASGRMQKGKGKITYQDQVEIALEGGAFA